MAKKLTEELRRSRYRDRWEYTHAADAVIKIAALSSLALSVVVETRGESLFES